jgi:23S rRNA pseudouridine1911/1915/1917 synthase
MPILGDTKYGTEQSIAYSREQKIRTVSLCAYSLTFMHPVNNKKMTVTL